MGGEAPLIDDSIGPHVLVVVTVSLAIALLCFSARIYTRVFPSYKLNAADFINSFAVFAEIITYSLFTTSIHVGFGRHEAFITPQMAVKLLKLRLAMMLTGPFASAAARISMVCQAITLARSVTGKRSLWAMVGVLLACLIVFDLSVLLQCRPIAAIWNPNIPYDQCLRTRTRRIINYTQVGAGIINDLAAAIIPTVFIWKLSRSRLERCLISILMSLGLCATGMGIAFIVHSKAMTKSTDPLRDSLITYVYCRMEEIFLLFASSVPFLKAPVEYVLCQFGAPGFHNVPRELASYHSNGVSDSQESSALPRQGLGKPKIEKDGDLLEGHANTLTSPYSSDGETGLDERRPPVDGLASG